MDGALVSQAHGQAGSQAVCQGHPCSPPTLGSGVLPMGTAISPRRPCTCGKMETGRQPHPQPRPPATMSLLCLNW